MAFRMVRLTRNTSGRWAARKVIPSDVRSVYGKREEKATRTAGLTEGQAKGALAAWLGPIEDQIASLRATAAPFPVLSALDLSQRESKGLAGVWYDDVVARYQSNPGDPHGWAVAAEEVIPDETAETYSMTGAEADSIQLRVSPWLRQEAAALVRGKGLRLTDMANDRLLQDMADAYLRFCRLMEQRAVGDWSADPLPATLPAWQNAPPAPAIPDKTDGAGGVTISALFEFYVAERQPAPATVRNWRRSLAHLGTFLGHEDATKITQDDIVRWKDHLMNTPTDKTGGKPRSVKTVREAYLAAAKAVFAAAKDNRRLPTNPILGVKVRGQKRVRLRDPSLSDAEATTILTAALAVPIDSRALHWELARRWVDLLRKSGEIP